MLGRLAERFGDVHVVPVGEIVFHFPIGGAAVDLIGEFQQRRVAGEIVKPVDAVQVVAAAHLLPIMGEELVVRHCQLKFKVARHHFQHARIVGAFVIGLEAKKHQHVGPEIARVIIVKMLVGTEIAVRPLAAASKS